MPDPYIICCAARVCCEDNSPEQLAAIAQIIEESWASDKKDAKGAASAAFDYDTSAMKAAKAIQQNFLLSDRHGRKDKAEFDQS